MRRATMPLIRFIFRNIIKLPVCLIMMTMGASFYTAASSAVGNGEFIVFPIVDIESRSSVTNLDQKTTEPKADFFFSKDFGNHRILAEALAEPEDDESQLDLERLQYGWIINPEIDIWVGRFHNPLGFWNSHFHHGAYLETAASRPSAIHFEDDDGILPMHISGIQINGHHDIEKGGIRYSLGIGAGPEIIDNKLEPVIILKPAKGSHKLGSTIRLAYYPNDDDVSTQFGGSVAFIPIPNDDITSGDIEQTIISVFGVWDVDAFHNLASIFRVTNEFDNTEDDSFTSAYIQSEYAWRPDWTGYGRIETSSSVNNDSYLSLFPRTITQRRLLGIRYEVKQDQALKLEISSSRTSDDNFDELHLQWSAAIQ